MFRFRSDRFACILAAPLVGVTDSRAGLDAEAPNGLLALLTKFSLLTGLKIFSFHFKLYQLARRQHLEHYDPRLMASDLSHSE